MAESELLNLAGVGPKSAKTLEDCGYNTIEKIAKAKADELSQLPGIGLATAEKIIASAKEFKPITKKPTAKTPIAKETEKLIDRTDIPKPKIIKDTPKTTEKKEEPRPSVKEPVIEKTIVPDIKIPEATREAIEKATQPVIIKKKRTKKSKPKKLVKISKTYGIVNSVLHDKTGKSKNRSVIMKLYETEIPIEKYLGRKVLINLPNSEKNLIGTITKLHGKRSSYDNIVIVRFSKSISPHILTARGTIL